MVWLPSNVSGRTFEPSRFTVKICASPVRVDVNARCRPFGAQLGLSFKPS
jgi:hypothetical protein